VEVAVRNTAEGVTGVIRRQCHPAAAWGVGGEGVVSEIAAVSRDVARPDQQLTLSTLLTLVPTFHLNLSRV